MDDFSYKKDRNISVRQYLIKYTLAFLVLVPIVFVYFYADEKSLVWHFDGQAQHYRALLYYSQWMREIIYGVVQNGTLNIPNFSLSFGLGADLFTTLQYYVIGDPLTLFSVFVPSKYMIYFYNFLIIFRFYLVGLSFSTYAFYHKKEQDAILVGALVYSFCTYSMYAGVRHPYFTNPMIYLPLLLLGVDKVRKENKPLTLISMVAISAMSNFYFFYMLVFFVIFYVAIVSFVPWNKGEFKDNLKTIFNIAKYSVLGTVISAVLFLPVVVLFLSDPRSGNGYEYDFFYNYRYYTQFLRDLITADFNAAMWRAIGTASIVLIPTFLLFKKKDEKNQRLKVAFVIMIVMFMLPIFGYALGGFSYVGNRWSWGFTFLVSYILVEMWDDLFNLSKNEIVYLGKCLAIYFLVCTFVFGKVTLNYLFSVVIVLLILFILVIYNGYTGEDKSKYKIKVQKLLTFFVMLNISYNAFYLYSEENQNYSAEFVPMEVYTEGNKASLTKSIKKVNNSGEFFRYGGRGLGEFEIINETLSSGLYNTQMYWSLINGNLVDLLSDTLTSIPSTHRFNGFDSRTALETLASTQYFETKSNDYKRVPYGFELITEKKSKYYIYENKFALPLGYTYASSVTEKEVENVTPLERQEIMLQTAIVEEELKGYDEKNLETTSKNIDYDIKTNSNKITMQGNSFVVTEPNQSVTLTFDGLENAETYVDINNLEFKGTSYLDLFLGGSDVDPLDLYKKEEFEEKTLKERHKLKKENREYVEPDTFNINFDKINDTSMSKNLIVRTPKYRYYSDRKDFLVNLCYSETPKNTVTITFPERGIYSYDDIKIMCQPMDNYGEQVNLLKEDVLENIDLHENNVNATNYISGTIQVDKPKILCITIPYSSGWTAYVDGEETELLKVNSAYMGLEIEPGEHKIELRYHTPALKIGLIISVVGIAITVIMFIMRKKNKQK